MGTLSFRRKRGLRLTGSRTFVTPPEPRLYGSSALVVLVVVVVVFVAVIDVFMFLLSWQQQQLSQHAGVSVFGSDLGMFSVPVCR